MSIGTQSAVTMPTLGRAAVVDEAVRLGSLALRIGRQHAHAMHLARQRDGAGRLDATEQEAVTKPRNSAPRLVLEGAHDAQTMTWVSVTSVWRSISSSVCSLYGRS
jgi:hypothetical protein